MSGVHKGALQVHTPVAVLVRELTLEREARALIVLARRVGEIFAEHRLTGARR